jgi:methanethiol S-methyltransferase
MEYNIYMINWPSFWILFAMVLYGVTHSILASLWFKAAFERWFGQGVKRWYRIFFNIVAVLTFFPILNLVIVLPDAQIYKISSTWGLATTLIQILAAVGLMTGVAQTGMLNFLGIEQMFSAAKAEAPHKMVVSGLYRWVRHPLYTCSFVFIWLAPVMTWNVLLFDLSVTAYLVIGTLYEERKLRVEFGDAYEQYQKRTPMFIPGLKPRNS